MCEDLGFLLLVADTLIKLKVILFCGVSISHFMASCVDILVFFSYSMEMMSCC